MQDVELDLAKLTVADIALEGIEIVRATPEHDRGAYAVALEADADIPSATPIVTGAFETWRDRHFGPLTSRDASRVALEDGVVVAFGIVSRFTDETYQHSMTGVSRRARGRGIAIALKRAQVVAAKRLGARYLRSQNDLGNVPMRSVNERLGYERKFEWVHLGGPLLPA
jgi:GNAT superfamily N-acetyltransferase